MKVNIDITKTMTNDERNITIEGQPLEWADDYIYLEQLIIPNKENQYEEIVRRMGLTWATYGKLKYILKNKKEVQLHMKTKVFHNAYCQSRHTLLKCGNWQERWWIWYDC